MRDIRNHNTEDERIRVDLNFGEEENVRPVVRITHPGMVALVLLRTRKPPLPPLWIGDVLSRQVRERNINFFILRTIIELDGGISTLYNLPLIKRYHLPLNSIS